MKLKVTLKGKPFVPDSDSYGDGLQWRRGPLLGKGGFASVFLAVPTASQSQSESQYMAVKTARDSDANSLKEEHLVLAALAGCPNIIKCFGDETTTGGDGTVAYNLLLEYGSGGSLRDRISKAAGGGGLPESEVRRYTRSILQGLDSIHRAGYVHCDLKPDNILLVQSGGEEAVAKVCDFGLAKKAGAADQHWRGTAMYSSPEAVEHGLQESPSDVWALGCIVLEMLTGKAAWEVEEGDDEDYEFEESILRQIGKGCVPKIPKHLSHDARTFLNGCLRRSVKNRLTAKTLLRHPFVDLSHL